MFFCFQDCGMRVEFDKSEFIVYVLIYRKLMGFGYQKEDLEFVSLGKRKLGEIIRKGLVLEKRE